MRIPRDVSGAKLVKALRSLGYQVTRQEGSHIRLTTALKGEHHITIPNHSPIKLGTLNGIPKAIALHQRPSMDRLLKDLEL